MPQVVVCPSCGKKLRVPGKKIGQGAKCPGCGSKMQLPHEEPDLQESFGQFDPPDDDPVHSYIEKQKKRSSNFRSLVPRLMTLAVVGSLLMSSIAMYIVLADRFQSPLSRYDLTSPESALLSTRKMLATNDLRAMMCLNQLKEESRDGSSIDEMLQTTKIHEKFRHKGTVYLFVSHEQSGLRKYDVQAMDKHTDRDVWITASVSLTDIDDNDLIDAISAWQRKKTEVGK